MLPFLVPLYPRPCVPSTKIQSMAGIRQCTYLFLVRLLPSWCCITHAHCVPSTKIQSMAGIRQCTCLFLVRLLPSWCCITHAHCVPSTEIQSLAGILQCTFFLFPSSGATFSGAPSFVLCVPLHQCVLPSTLVAVGPRINPYQRHPSPNGEVWVGL